MGLGFKKGFVWTVLGKYSQMFVSLAVTMILARLLSPSDFGIVASVLIFNNFIYTFIDAGISSAIIQKEELFNEDLKTFNSVGLLLGMSIFLIFLFFGSTVADFLKVAEIEKIAPIIGINFIILGLVSVPNGILQRDLHFEKLAKTEIISSFLSGGVAIFIAYLEYGYWAIVFQLIVQLFLKYVIASYYSGFFYFKVFFDKKSLLYLKNYSGYLVLFSSINYWSRNYDNLVVAKLYGKESLGLYSQAYRVMFLPVQLISSVVNVLIHPYYAKRFNSGKTLSEVYCLTFSVTLLLSAPISSFILFNPELVLKILWGDQWISASKILSVLSVLSLIQPGLVTTGDVFKSTNNNKLLFKVGILNTIITVFFITIGASLSFYYVSVFYVISYVFFVTPITMYYICKYALNISLFSFLKKISFSIILVLILYVINYFLSFFVEDNLVMIAQFVFFDGFIVFMALRVLIRGRNVF